MSGGGQFQLITNDGKVDRLLLATELLNSSIAELTQARMELGFDDPTPDISELEQSHVIFTVAHYKPFVSIAIQYDKVKVHSGTQSLGGTLQFNLPQTGDFFCDMVLHVALSSVNSSSQTAPAQDVVGFPENGKDWDNDTDLANSEYTLVDPFGATVSPNGGTFRNLVRYCEYPGERLAKKVSFEVNSNSLDTYHDTTVSMLRKNMIPVDKLPGYDRLMGQQTALEGYSGPVKVGVRDPNSSGQPDTELASDPVFVPAAGAPDVHTNPNTGSPVSFGTSSSFVEAAFPDAAHTVGVPSSTSAPYFGVIQRRLQCYDGFQTPKYQQPTLNIWHPLQFWFNKDVRLAIPSVAIPYGQRLIEIELAKQDQLVYEAPGLYVAQTIRVEGDGDSDSGNAGVFSRKYRPWSSAGTLTSQSLSDVDLYVNSLFVNPEIHDIYMRKIGFTLIRVYRRHTTNTNTSTHDEQQLNQLKWAIEYMFIGLQPTINTASSNSGPTGTVWRDWHRMAKVFEYTDDRMDHAVIPEGTDGGEGGGEDLPAASSLIGQIVPDVYIKEVPTISTLSLEAYGMNLFQTFPQVFYSAYIPYYYANFVTGRDIGSNIINFALIPAIYQPSGHLNNSRARELFIKFDTTYVSSSNNATLFVIAVCINFLLITDGTAVLRFST